MSRESAVNLALCAAFLALPAWAAWAEQPYTFTLATKAAVLALAGVGLNIALGIGGLVSFGHAAFFGIGGYAAGILANHAALYQPLVTWPVTIEGTQSMPVIWLVALLASGAMASVIGALSLRTAGIFFIMITLAFAQMVYYLANSWPAYGGEDGLPIYLRNGFPGIDTLVPAEFCALVLAVLGLALALSWRFAVSRVGLALSVAHEAPERAAAMGIDVTRIRLAGFVLSGMVTGLAGALFADLNGFVSPTMLSWHTSGELLVIVILGGVGRLFGPIAGAAMLVGLEHLLGEVTDHWRAGLGLALLAVVLFARGGLIGLLAGPARHA